MRSGDAMLVREKEKGAMARRGGGRVGSGREKVYRVETMVQKLIRK